MNGTVRKWRVPLKSSACRLWNPQKAKKQKSRIKKKTKKQNVICKYAQINNNKKRSFAVPTKSDEGHYKHRY